MKRKHIEQSLIKMLSFPSQAVETTLIAQYEK